MKKILLGLLGLVLLTACAEQEPLEVVGDRVQGVNSTQEYSESLIDILSEQNINIEDIIGIMNYDDKRFDLRGSK